MWKRIQQSSMSSLVRSVLGLFAVLAMVAIPVAANSLPDEGASSEFFDDGVCGGDTEGLDLDVCTCSAAGTCDLHTEVSSGDALAQNQASDEHGAGCDGSE